MPDNHAPFIADDTMRHYDELSQLGKRYHDGDKAVGAVTEYGNKAWGAGNDSAHGDYAQSMGLGGVGGGLAGLLHEALRNKTEQEKNQTMGRKFMRYAGKGGIGALAGAGAGGLYQAAMGKQALLIPAWGGRDFNAAPRGVGVGLNAGWSHLAGILPVPHAGIDIGGPHHGLQLSGPLPGIGLRAGLFSRPPGLSSTTSYPRSLWATLADNSSDPDELEERKYQEGLKRFKNLREDEIAGGLEYMNPDMAEKLRGSVAKQLFTESRRPAKKPAVKAEKHETAKAAASEWKPVDLAKNPINWSRTLPKADASSKNWQGAGQKPAAPPMVPVNQAPPMAPVGAKSAADDNDNKPNGRKQRAKNRAEDLVPMQGFGRGYADYALPSTFGGTRAGRATMIAKALGQNPDFSVSHPNTDMALSSLVGGTTFGLGGAGIGALLGALGGNPAAGALVGGGIGGMAGSLGGIAGSGMERREQMQNIQDDLANELEQHGTSRLNLKTPQYGVASSLLSPLGGAHRAGQADAYEALKNNTRYAKTPGRTAGYLAAHIPYAGPLLNMGQGIAQNFSARKRMKQDQPEIADNYGLNEFGSAKAAHLRNFGAKVAAFNIGDLTKHLPAGVQSGLSAAGSRLGAMGGAAGAGALGGAALGGLAGLISPGHEDVYDDEGNVVGRQRRGRFGAAMRGALGGGAAGGLAGAGMSAFAPKATEQLGQWLNNQGQKARYQYTMHTPVPTQAQAQAKQNFIDTGAESYTDPATGVSNPAMMAAQRG